MRIDPTSASLRSLLATAPAAKAAAPAQTGAPALSEDMPALPPREVLDEVERAMRRVDELAAAGLELAYDVDPASGRLLVELRDLDGATRGAMTPTRALDVAAGAPVA